MNGGETISVSWDEEPQARLPVSLQLTATDREGLLRDVASVVAEEGYNITSASTSTTDDGIALLRVRLEISDVEALTRLLNRLQSIRNVFSARREGPNTHHN